MDIFDRDKKSIDATPKLDFTFAANLICICLINFAALA